VSSSVEGITTSMIGGVTSRACAHRSRPAPCRPAWRDDDARGVMVRGRPSGRQLKSGSSLSATFMRKSRSRRPVTDVLAELRRQGCGANMLRYRSFGLRLETTAAARSRLADSVTTPTARSPSTRTWRTAVATRISAPRAVALRHRLGDGAHAADGMTPGAALAVHLAEHVMQQDVCGPRRIGARVVADDAVEAVHGLDRSLSNQLSR